MRKSHGKPIKREDESPRFRVRRSGFPSSKLWDRSDYV